LTPPNKAQFGNNRKWFWTIQARFELHDLL